MTCRATSTASSTRRPAASPTSSTSRRRAPWLSDADLDVFVDSYSHHGTFFGGLNWYRNIDHGAEQLAAFAGVQVHQPALFIGAEFDSIFGQTPESVLATRAAVPNLREPVWAEGSGHWIAQGVPRSSTSPARIPRVLTGTTTRLTRGAHKGELGP